MIPRARLSLALSLVLVAACSPAAPPPASAPTEAPQVPETGATAAPEAAVEIGDNAFTSADLSVPAGATVTWTHAGSNPHTVTADDGAFDSGELQAGATFAHTFDQPGTFAYHCQIHGGAGGTGMAGTVTVTAAAAATTAPAAGGTFAVEGAVANRDVTQAATFPGLAIGSTTAGEPGNPWVTWAENASGGLRQIFVSELIAGKLEPRGTALNIHLNGVADRPSITFAGQDRAVPWVAWDEPSPGFGNASQVFASRFNAASGLWQPAGQDRGGSEPSLNLHTNRAATRPFIFGGSGDPTQPPVPWVVWEEQSGASNFLQVVVAKGVKDEAAIGGFRWEFVGQIRGNQEPTLNLDVNSDGRSPSGVFAETGNSVPWIIWTEHGDGRLGRVFTVRGVADANTPGGFKWISVPPCSPDEGACTLNVNPLREAKDASMTAGSLQPGEASVPWTVWAEVGPSGKLQIFVSRLDTATRNSFLNVGASLNVDQNHDAKQPRIVFVKNVPYVAWLEDDGNGVFRVHARHLASDPQTGTWQLDSPPEGFNRNASATANYLFAASADDTLFLAWDEGDPAAEASQIVLGRLGP